MSFEVRGAGVRPPAATKAATGPSEAKAGPAASQSRSRRLVGSFDPDPLLPCSSTRSSPSPSPCSRRPRRPQTRPAPPLPAGIEEVTRVEGITEYRLKNGLQLLLVPDDSKPSTTVNVTYRVGSRLESYGETGMAHLLEHLLFKGTPTTRNVWAEFTKRGLRANGSTWYDRTNYFATFAANDDNLRWYLGWQADAMINSFIARADLDTEMTVVRNEMEAGENSPTRVLLQQTMAAMYQWHNYGKATIGARADVENVDIPRLQAFYRNYYQPDNATLIVSGRFDSARVLEIVAQSFGADPAADADDRPDLHPRPAAGRRARGHPAPRRRRAAGLRRLSRAAGSERRFRRGDAAGGGARRHPGRSPLQEPGRAPARGQHLRLHPGAGRAEPALHRRGAGADAGRGQGARGDRSRPSIRSPPSRSAPRSWSGRGRSG